MKTTHYKLVIQIPHRKLRGIKLAAWQQLKKVQLRNVKCLLEILLLDGKVGKAHERNFHERLSNESFSQYLCVEATLPFSAVAQRLRIGGNCYEQVHRYTD